VLSYLERDGLRPPKPGVTYNPMGLLFKMCKDWSAIKFIVKGDDDE